MGTRAHYIPEDYEDLYLTYFDPSQDSFVRGLTRRYAGSKASESDVEDLLHATFERMLRLKQLEKFDPERGNFGLFLQQIIRSVTYNWHAKSKRTPTSLGTGGRGERYRRGRRSDREGGKAEDEENLILLGLIAEQPSPEEIVAYAELERRLFEAAEAAGASENPSTRDANLEPMLNLLASGIDAKDAAAELGVSPSTITHWRRHLREAITA